MRTTAVSACVLALLFSNLSAGQAANDVNAAAARDRQAFDQVRADQLRREADRQQYERQNPRSPSSGESSSSEFQRVDCWNGEYVYRFQCPPSPAEIAAAEQATREHDERNRVINAELAEQDRRNAEAAARDLQEQIRRTAELRFGGSDRLAELWQQWNTRSGLPSSWTDLVSALNRFRVDPGTGYVAAQQADYLLSVVQLEMAEEWRFKGDTEAAAEHMRQAIFKLLSLSRTVDVDYELSLVAMAQQLVARLTTVASPYRVLLPPDYEALAAYYTPDIRPVAASPGRYTYDLDGRSEAIRELVTRQPPEAREQEIAQQRLDERNSALEITDPEVSQLKTDWDQRSRLPSENVALLDRLHAFASPSSRRAVYFTGSVASFKQARYMAGLLQLEMAEEWQLRGDLEKASLMLRGSLSGFGEASVTDNGWDSVSPAAFEVLMLVTATRGPYGKLLPSNVAAIIDPYLVRTRQTRAAGPRSAWDYDLAARRAEIRRLVTGEASPAEGRRRR